MAPTAFSPSAAIICRAAPRRAGLADLGEQLAGVPLGPAGGLAHGFRGDAAERRDPGRHRGPVGQHPVPGAGQGGRGRMRAGIERRARGRAAGLVGAQVGPVASVLDAQDVQHVDPGRPRRGAQRARHRVDQRPGTVADRHQRGQPLRAEHADGVRGDVRGDPRAGRIGQVVAERDLDRGRGAPRSRSRPGWPAARSRAGAARSRAATRAIRPGPGRDPPAERLGSDGLSGAGLGGAWGGGWRCVGRCGVSSPAVSVCVMKPACGRAHRQSGQRGACG